MKHRLIYIVIFSFSGLFAQEKNLLQRYEMYSDHFNIDGYTKQYQRSFDSVGIIKQKNEYHALTISLYGIMCYDEYKRSGSEYYLEQFKNQYKYFQDSSKLNFLFNGEGIGLPYHFKFHDLSPPWYSGLTQGIALSYLLRYYEYSNDPEVKMLVQKVAKPLLVPVEDGGTLSKTPEGYLWIEEYPNTKKSKNVLNGFINGLVGLKEYITFFPNDTVALRVHNEVYESLKKTVNEYDTPKNWSTYDRNNKSISVFYLRIQLTQFDHLYSLYKDEFFRKQMSIWSRMIIGKKDNELKFYLYPSYSYGVAISPKLDENGYSLNFTDEFQKALLDDSSLVLKSKNKIVRRIDQDLVVKKNLRIITGSSPSAIEISLANPKKKKLRVYFTDGTDKAFDFNPYLASQSFSLNKDFDSVEILTTGMFNKRIVFNKCTYYDYRTYKVPFSASLAILGSSELSHEKKYKMSYDGLNVKNAEVFYRYATNKDNLVSSKWRWNQSYKLDEVFEPQESGFYEFFIAVQIQSPFLILQNVHISEIE